MVNCCMAVPPRFPGYRTAVFCFPAICPARGPDTLFMSSAPSPARQRLLDPIERSSEVLFGLIMVLTFTGSLRASGLDHDDVHRMMLAALGCNLAWGIIHAVFSL